MKIVTLIKAHSINGIIKPIGTELIVTSSKIEELAKGGFIETDKRYKEPKPKKSKIKIENTQLKTDKETTSLK